MKKKFSKKKKFHLPSSFRPLLWSYDFSRIDVDRNKKVIIVNAINYGDLEQWKWLIGYYGKDVIADVVSHLPMTELRPSVQRLVSLVFNIKKFHYAKRNSRRTG